MLYWAGFSTPERMGQLWIANTITDLIDGDVREHIPLERIPLQGDVLGMGTTTSYDNGELAFRYDGDAGRSRVYKALPEGGGVEELIPGEGLHHFPYACFSADASRGRQPLSAADLAALQIGRGELLQEVVARAIHRLVQQQRLPQVPVYGLRLVSEWQSLVYTVASKLCMGQRRRNRAVTVSEGQGSDGGGSSIYTSLKHFRVDDGALELPSAAQPLPPAAPAAGSVPITNLGASPAWDCCGFWDTQPELGRLTVPVAGAHLHLHGCSLDLRHGGHLHHEHPGSSLASVTSLVLYPFDQITLLGSDLAVEALAWDPETEDFETPNPETQPGEGSGSLRFVIRNRGQLDVSDVGVAVVMDDHYGSHRYLRVPWLAAGDHDTFVVPLRLPKGVHQLEVLADPHGDVIEPTAQQGNNRAALQVVVR